ncbi:MAG: SpoIIE family protein phosphatase [Spirochaetia bacterium]
MGITLLNYIAAPIMLFSVLYILLKAPGNINSWIIFLFGLGASGIALNIGIAFDFGNSGYFQASLVFVKIAAVSQMLAFLSMFRLSLSFPYKKKLHFVNIILALFLLIVSYIIFRTPWYVQEIVLRNGVFFRIEGPAYKYFYISILIISIAAIIIFMIRSSRLHNKIFRLQSYIIVLGTAGAIVLGSLISVVLPSVLQRFDFYPASAVTSVIFLSALMYAIVTYRLFEISAALYKTILFFLLTGVFSVLFSLGVLAIYPFLRNLPPFLVYIVIIVLFSFGVLLRFKTQSRFESILRHRKDYSRSLESALDKLDLGEGKGTVINGLRDVFAKTVRTTRVHFICENSIGELVPIYSYSSLEIQYDRHARWLENLVNSGIDIIFRNEIAMNPALAQEQQQIEKMFSDLQAEALLFFHEGTHIFAVISLGEKEGGEEYTMRDYQALNRNHPKLFVIMYFLRTLEKQSLAITVEKELLLSEQIIHTLRKNIDPVFSEKADFAYVTKMSAGLGGDFVDLVNQDENTSLLIVGDVAGKGLNASMSMIILKSVIRTFLRETKTLSELIGKVNIFVKRCLPRGTFFAGAFMRFDFENDTVSYVNCGIPLIAMYSQTYKTVLEIQGEGKILGFVKDVEKMIDIKEADLNPGDLLFLTTDGILESMSRTGEYFEKKRIVQHLMEHSHERAQENVDALFSTFSGFVGNQFQDDITLVAIHYRQLLLL